MIRLLILAAIVGVAVKRFLDEEPKEDPPEEEPPRCVGEDGREVKVSFEVNSRKVGDLEAYVEKLERRPGDD